MVKHADILRANIIFHNQSAQNYHNKPLVVGKFTVKRLKQLIKRLSVVSGGNSFLDLGTGTGNLLDFCESSFDNVYGIDTSINLLKFQKPGRKLCLGDANNLPFKEGTFNCIGIFSVLHHFHELSPLIKECYRVLKKEGVFYSDYDPNYYFKRLINPILNLLNNKPKNNNQGAVTDMHDLAEYYGRAGLKPKVIVKILKDAGFREIKVNYHMYAKSFARIDFAVYLIDKLTNFLGINFFMKNFSPQFTIIARK